jgi:hypothetical protein
LAIVGRALGSLAQHNFISDAILPLTVKPTGGRSPASTLSLMAPTDRPSNGTCDVADKPWNSFGLGGMRREHLTRRHLPQQDAE